MYTEVCPSNPVQYLEDNLPELLQAPDLETIRGARVAVEYISQAYPDSSELTELYRSTSGLAVSKTLPAPWERASDQTWRAQALLALAGHKVATRDAYDEQTMRTDFRRPFEVSSPMNYGYIRRGIYQKYHDKVASRKPARENEERATRVMKEIAEEFTFDKRDVWGGLKKVAAHYKRQMRDS